MGKIGVRWLLIGGLAAALIAMALVGARRPLAESETLSRAALWLTIVVAYAGIWFGLAVAVNALALGSATNAMVLAGTWLAFGILVPALLNVAVQTAHPVPSRVELIGAMRQASNAASARGSQTLAKYYEDHPELVPAGDSVNIEDFTSRSYSVQEAVDREMRPVLARYEEQLDRQRALVNRYRFLSPAIVVHDALSDLAGTGSERYRHFLALATRYHAEWQRYFLPRIFRRSLLSPADYARFPQYRFSDEPSRVMLGRVSGALGTLAFPLVALWGVGLFGLRRYRVAG
jgi:ABC-2 type transport system permease protein